MQLRMTFVSLVLLVAAFCAEETTTGQEEQRRTLCGRALANAHMVLCATVREENKFNNFAVVEGFSSLKTTVTEMPLRSRSWPKTPSRSKREIATECCLKPCTVMELLSYC